MVTNKTAQWTTNGKIIMSSRQNPEGSGGLYLDGMFSVPPDVFRYMVMDGICYVLTDVAPIPCGWVKKTHEYITEDDRHKATKTLIEKFYKKPPPEGGASFFGEGPECHALGWHTYCCDGWGLLIDRDSICNGRPFLFARPVAIARELGCPGNVLEAIVDAAIEKNRVKPGVRPALLRGESPYI